ncbi:WD repeat and HMG-box DNA binding-domain containing protein 1 [Allomyces javanicus]|nr:WD repeat and HMG-box DNA binding-domain containing protein 1 [Allomyces javanicus]
MTTPTGSAGPRVNHTLWGTPRALSYSLDGSILATTEDTGIARLFKTDPQSRESEPAQLTHVSLQDANAIACHRSMVAVSAKGTVMLFGLPAGEYLRLVTRHTLPVTCLDISMNGQLVASGSEDHSIRVTSTENIEEMFELNGHKAPVTSVAFDPLGTYLASAGCDGRLLVWNVQERSIAADLSILRSLRDVTAKDAPKLRWCPSGKYIAVSGLGNEIALVVRNKFTVHAKLAQHKQPVTALDWSPNGRFLATTSLDSRTLIWNVETLLTTGEIPFLSPPTLVRWQTNRNTLAITLENQTLTMIDDPIADEVVTTRRVADDQPMLDLFNDSSAAPVAAAVPARPDPVAGAAAAVVPPEVDVDDDMDASDLDDFLVDDEDGNKSRKEKKEDLKKQFLRAGFTEATPMQPAFQPGSTPALGGKRYLAFNTTGVITSVEQDVRHAYHIEFHDKSRMRRPVQFNDPREFTLAALSTRAAAFACPGSTARPDPLAIDDLKNEDEELPGALHVRLLDTWSAGTRPSWTFPFPNDEAPEGLAVGQNHVVVVTDSGTVRILSIGGVQLHAFSLAGRFVACTAHLNWLMLVTHAAAPFNGNQQLDVTVYDLDKLSVIHEGRLPLTPRTHLTWIGVSSQLVPLAVDSAGVLRGLAVGGDRQWTPLLDTAQHVPKPSTIDDGPTHSFAHWPVGMVATTFLTILCRVPANVPPHRAVPPFPRPAMSEIEAQVPDVLGAATAPPAGMPDDRGSLETQWITAGFFHRHAAAHAGLDLDDLVGAADRTAKDRDKLALVLMQAACKSERVQRALDLAAALVLDGSLDKAVKVAAFNQMPALGDRIRQIQQARETVDPLDALLDDDVPPPPTSHRSRRSAASSAYAPSAATHWTADPVDADAPAPAPTIPQRRSRRSQYGPKDDYSPAEPTVEPETKRPRMSNPFARKSSANPFATMNSGGGGGDTLARTSSFGVVMSGSPAPAPAAAGRTSVTRQSTLSQMMGVRMTARKSGAGERAAAPAAVGAGDGMDVDQDTQELPPQDDDEV